MGVSVEGRFRIEADASREVVRGDERVPCAVGRCEGAMQMQRSTEACVKELVSSSGDSPSFSGRKLDKESEWLRRWGPCGSHFLAVALYMSS